MVKFFDERFEIAVPTNTCYSSNSKAESDIILVCGHFNSWSRPNPDKPEFWIADFKHKTRYITILSTI